jgi:hypothetical protein
MASANTLSRLHMVAQTERAPIKLPNLGNLEIDVSAPSMLELFHRSLLARPRQFALPSGEANWTQAPAMMSTMHPSAQPDQAGRFAALAERNSTMEARAWLARHASLHGKRSALGAKLDQGWATSPLPY